MTEMDKDNLKDDASKSEEAINEVEKTDSLNDEDFEELNDNEEEEVTSERDNILARLKDEAMFNKKKIKTMEDQIKRLTNEVEAYKERLLRLNAEYENYRARSEKEKKEMGAEGTAGAVKNILPVIDNLERALKTEATDLEGLYEGVNLTLGQFAQALDKLGVEMIKTDEGFDPNFHEAVMHSTDPEKGPNEVDEVFLKGYKIGDKVIRHSVVKVVN